MSYPGGKNGAGVYQKIINLMPPHEVYIEPFLGGAAIMRLKRPAARNIGVDLVPSLELPLQAFTASCGEPVRRAVFADGRPAKEISAEPAASADAGHPGPLANSRGEVLLDPLTESGEGRSLIARSGERRRRASLNPARTAARVKSGETAGNIAISDAPSWEFIQGDGIQFLKSYRFTGRELVYCDPPYLMETRSGRRLYQHELSSRSHRRLLRVIQVLPAHVMISGYWSQMYADALQDWHSIHFEAMTRGGRTATEWLWFNFAPPVALHDYQFLGENFRERERIKRKKHRWTARLNQMPRLERQALLCAIADTVGTADAGQLST